VLSRVAKLIALVVFIAGLTGPAMAGGRDKLIAMLAAVTAAPHVCYAPVDPDLLDFVVNEARPRGDERFDEDVEEMTLRIRADAVQWTPEQMSEFCANAIEMARAFGLVE
jgi:hypothetical protein